jgi:periplasmic copper chaperone A
MRARHLLLGSLLLVGCRTAGPPAATAQLGDLHIDQGYAFEPITPASGAAYFRIRNAGSEADTLLEATSPVAQSAAFHGSNMSHMQALVLPPGGEVELKPGGTHLMLTGFSPAPHAGDSLAVTLRFARAGSLTLELPVRQYGQ